MSCASAACHIGGIELDNKDKKLSTIVNGYQVTLSFTDEPQKEMAGKIRGILLDSYIVQNKGVVPQCDSEEFDEEEVSDEEENCPTLAMWDCCKLQNLHYFCRLCSYDEKVILLVFLSDYDSYFGRNVR